ncbi:MAG TPA: RDD family protein [Planctomycetota bacterium]|nr:RDD family protein [Planctomycetota bacterium]
MSITEWQLVRSPEGIDLRFGVATASERLAALAIDLLIVLFLMFASVLVLVFLGMPGAALLAFFLLRQGYFIWFETRGNGTTFGKRRFHLRVIRADGGPLTTEILLARNLTREVELFVPMVLLLNPDALFAEHEGVTRLVASLWILLLMFFPLTNPQRLRIGDLLAGTRVVVSPPVALRRDLADRTRSASVAAEAYRFTPAQLSIYGEHELGVLEDVLRKARSTGSDQALEAVAKSICKRISVDVAAVGNDHAAFLQAFYAAQRQHLEQQLLLGRRRLRKAERGKPRQ